MAKRSYTKKHRELDDLPEEKEEIFRDNYEIWSDPEEVSIKDDVLTDIETQDEPTHKTLVLMKDIGTLKATGAVSGNVYVFHGAGSKVEVLMEDVEGLLNKINPNNCCSGSQQQPYFSLE